MEKRTIKFDEAQHKYTDEDNKVYTSVTTLIGEYTPQFDKKFWSNFKANQTGLSQQEVLNNWQQITDEASARGTKEHKLLEDSINSAVVSRVKLLTTALVPLSGIEFTNINLDVLARSELSKKYPEIFEYLSKAIKGGARLYVEKRTYSYEHLVAGTIDCLLVKGKQFYIVDWKTNKKELHFKSGYYRKVGGIESTEWVDKDERMLGPLNHLQNCKGTIYTLQLSLYAYILEMWGLECKGLILYHIRPDHKPKPYNIIYDRMSVELLMIHHKNKLTQIKNQSSIKRPPPRFGITSG
jgi:ATP-dependent exoDNAse (exonuclease V) beta subunit